MARRFKFIGKKRGDRATGSGQEGRLGEAIFYLVLLLLGSGALVAVLQNFVVPEWRVHRVYEAADAEVLGTKIEIVTAEDPNDDTIRYQPQIQVEYHVGEKNFSAWTYQHWQSAHVEREDAVAVTERYEVGQHVTCWYDPADPTQVVLIRGFNWWVWLILLLPTMFILVGLGGLAYTMFHSRTSRERRAALAKQVADRELFEGVGTKTIEFPAVPADSDLKNSPGTTLTYRLPIEASPGWKLFGVILACLFWNGIVSLFVVMAVQGHMAGEPDWLLTLFMVPFVAVGVGLIYGSFRQLLVSTGVGPTLIEISQHPLRPGKEYEMLLSQGGNLTIRQLEVHLVCREKATYCQGTDTVTDTEVIHRLPVLQQENINVEAGMPYETRCHFHIPADAMHSFLAQHNAINWKLSVEVEVARWPDFQRDFPVVVCPESTQKEAS